MFKVSVCKKCGNNLPSDDVQFCSKCGTAVDGSAARDNPSTISKDNTTASQSKPKSGMDKASKLAIVIIVTALVVTGIIFMIGSNISAHKQYCANWNTNLDKQKAILDSNPNRGDAISAQYNTESAQYNKECAF